MNEYKKPSGVPWRIWAALFGFGLVLYGTYQLSPPSFEHSPPHLVFHGATLTAEFEATNHGRTQTTKKLNVSIGTLRTGVKGSGPHYTPIERRDISVSLAPSETKRIRCDFSASGCVAPNAAEVIILE